jgi:hypothetical protein
MATNILPPDYQVSPIVSQDELEDLIVQVAPNIEEQPYSHMEAMTAQLRSAVEKLLVAYRQSIFLSEHGTTMLPAQHWQLAETIAANYRLAWKFAGTGRTVTRAFDLFLANMDIEGVGSHSLQSH